MWGPKKQQVRYFHRVPECLGLEGILKTIYFQFPAMISLFLSLLAGPVLPAPGTGCFCPDTAQGMQGLDREIQLSHKKKHCC